MALLDEQIAGEVKDKNRDCPMKLARLVMAGFFVELSNFFVRRIDQYQ